MKETIKRIFALILVVALVSGLAVPALAANESNSKGVVFSAALSNDMLQTSSEDQTVVLNINASPEITLDCIEYVVNYNSALTLTSFSCSDTNLTYDSGDLNLNYGTGMAKVAWNSDSGDNITAVTNIGQITFTIPANTPAGTYEFSATGIKISQDYGTKWENTASASATLSIVDGSTNSYVASLNCSDTDLNVGQQLTVNVAVNGMDADKFASGEVILTYDSTKLTFNKTASILGTATIPEQVSGTIKLEDYGETKNFGNAYTLVFDTAADGNAEVKLTSAKFSTYANAASDNLVDATLSNATVTAKLTRVYTVTLPEGFTGASTVTKGADYTFSANDTSNYTYTVTATMGGQEATVTDNKDGTYTISGVTGALVISATPKANSYTVTFAGDGAGDVADKVTTATYNTPYSFTMPANTAEYTYSLTSIKYAGGGDVPYTTENGVVTVAGTNITDAFTITIAKEKVQPTTASVTVEGASSDVTYSTTATPGADYTFTVNKDSRYDYEVSATVNGGEVTLTVGENGQYSIPYSEFKAGDAIKISVVKIVRTDNVTVTEYITVDEALMWLITINTTKLDGSVYTYKEENMYWSAKYNSGNGAYCYLVFATEKPSVAASDLAIVTGSATEVDYGMDVNMTDKVDANDAQLVYNMYKPYYNNFTADVTMEEFLRADVNYDSKINVSDAQVIINSLLSQTGE